MAGNRLWQVREQNAERPRNVGILALDVYIPSLAVCQGDLEKLDGVEGKYTIGLGQSTLRMCGDQEDTVSMAMSAVASLLSAYDVQPEEIGRVDVGTESDLDTAKPIKSFLMELLGAGDVEGADHRAACYAATSGLLTAVDWVTGQAWDGRLALVVGTDVSIYTDPGARATGGAGAVAMLVGPDAPLVLQRSSVSSHCSHTYDWYKPAGPVPQVDGKLSVSSYLNCLEHCFDRLCDKHYGHKAATSSGLFDHAVLHHPYNKLAQKGAARLGKLIESKFPALTEGDINSEEQVVKRAKRSSSFYDTKVHASTLIGRECGNMYTGSVYAALASLIHAKGRALVGADMLMYSYGSGAMSSMFVVKGRHTGQRRFELESIQNKLDLQRRLEQRKPISPQQLHNVIALQIERHGKANWRPVMDPLQVCEMPSGSYFLERVDERHRRRYKRVGDSEGPRPPSTNGDAVG